MLNGATKSQFAGPEELIALRTPLKPIFGKPKMLKQRGYWRVVSRVAHWAESPGEEGAKSFPRDCPSGQYLARHSGAVPDSSMHGAKTESTGQGNLRTNLNNIVSFRRTRVATAA